MSWPFGDLQLFRYGAILADPPWQVQMWSEKGMSRSPDGPITRGKMRSNDARRHYPTMPTEEIKALPVNHLAAPDCILFLWAIDPMLKEAIEVGEAWGFTLKTVGFYWAKRRRVTSRRGADVVDPWHKEFPMSTGYWTRSNPEQCLLFTRGSPQRRSTSVRKLIIEPRREHSRKPDRVHADIEQLCHGPYAELFARRRRPGWDCWGNDIDRFESAS